MMEVPVGGQSAGSVCPEVRPRKHEQNTISSSSLLPNETELRQLDKLMDYTLYTI